LPDAIAVRDSKNPAAPPLFFAPHAWAAFAATLKGSPHA
jgi:Domain of unknown function (DUF397)